MTPYSPPTFEGGDNIDIQEIQRLIPHRFPMLMVDRLTHVIPGEQAIGIKNLSINEWFFQGHFPGAPITPGVLVVEAMAQTAGVVVMKFLGSECSGKLVYFMSVEEACFRRPVGPGDTLKIYVLKKRNRANVWKFRGEAWVEKDLVAEATFTAMIK